MHKNSLFFMFLFFVTFCSQNNLHSMQLNKTSRALLRKQSHTSQMRMQKLCVNAKANTNSVQKGEIQSYNSPRDEASVARIAMQHMYALTDLEPSDQVKEQYPKRLHDTILPALNDDAVTSKIYRLNDKTIGFINYRIDEPGPLWRDAMVNHLAIDNEYHGKGYGGELLSDALRDCHNQSVRCVALYTRWHDNKLPAFYSKFGFECTNESKYTGTSVWMKRLKPHPLVMLAHMIRDWLYTFKNK